MYICPDCNIAHDSLSSYKYHGQILHGSGENFKCVIIVAKNVWQVANLRYISEPILEKSILSVIVNSHSEDVVCVVKFLLEKIM